MAPRYPIALLMAIATIAGCGGPSDGERRSAQAPYVARANAVCASASRAVAGHNQRPKLFFFLQRSVQDSRNTLTKSTARLHRLRGALGDSASAQIAAFDRALDPFLKSLDPLTVAAEKRERRQAVAVVRRRGDVLYRAARAAKLTDCGRGGNAIADRAVYFDYRRGYITVDQRERRRLLPLDRAPTSVADATQINRRVLSAMRSNYASTGRLVPPRRLRRLHQAARRAQAAVIRTREALAPFTAREQAGDLPEQLARQTPAFYRIERKLRAAMNR